MTLMDAINHRFGRNTIQLAVAGIEKPWRARSDRKSGTAILLR